MRKTILFWVSSLLSFGIVMTSLTWAQIQKVPQPAQKAPQVAIQSTNMPKPTFTSMVPNPFQLAPGIPNQFTITGTLLNTITRFTLVNSRAPLWVLTADITAKSAAAITATVKVPKYLALGTYQIQAMSDAGIIGTGLIAQGNENKPSAVWTEFLPQLHGFNFVNYGWGKICYEIVGGHLEYKQDSPRCDSGWGLCGGMSLNAGENFHKSVGGTHDLAQAAAKPDLVDAQFRTLDGPTVAKILEWIYSPDQGSMTNPMHSIGYRMQQDWNGLIKPQLDAHKSVVLGLIFDKVATVISQLNPANVSLLTNQHQVLGIGYTRSGASTVRIVAYDPNIKDDILILTFEAGKEGVAQQLDSGAAFPPGRRHVRGVMFIRSVP